MSGVSRINLSTPKKYKISNGDDCIAENWTVTVTIKEYTNEQLDDVLSFQTFHFEGADANVQINYTDQTILVEVPCHVDRSDLVASFITGSLNPDIASTVLIGGVPQVNGVTSNAFINPVVYSIAANCYTQNWVVIVEQLNLSEDEFTVPNVITPNGDQFNEFFTIGNELVGSEINIFNRYGKLVYSSHNITTILTGGIYPRGFIFIG